VLVRSTPNAAEWTAQNVLVSRSLLDAQAAGVARLAQRGGHGRSCTPQGLGFGHSKESAARFFVRGCTVAVGRQHFQHFVQAESTVSRCAVTTIRPGN